MIPFVLSMVIINLLACAFRGQFPPRCEALICSDIILIAAFLACLPAKFSRCGQWLLIITILLLEMIEAFISHNFTLLYEYSSLLVFFETNTTEVSGFVTDYILSSKNLLFYLCWIALVLCLVSIYHYKDKAEHLLRSMKSSRLTAVVVTGVVLVAVYIQYSNRGFKQHVYQTLTAETDVYFDRYWMGRYNSLARILIAVKQVDKCTDDIEASYDITTSAVIDSTTHTSPLIVLYIGESYAKRHSQLYGYKIPTTPNDLREQEEGNLFAYTDVTTPYNITSTTFKNLFSTHSIDEPGNWCDEPLCPYLLKKAGYRTSFFSNQFVGTYYREECVIGDFFLDNVRVRNLLFDEANTERYAYDESLLPMFQKAIDNRAENKFMILHVYGQHTSYTDRYPASHTTFTSTDYTTRKDLSQSERRYVAGYDNAIHYQDSIDGVIFDKLRDKDAIVVFVSDHGEEVLDFPNHVYGRRPYRYAPDIVRSEYEIPMWIWCSPMYRKKHAAIVDAIRSSIAKPLINTDLSHLILELAGIKTKYFDPTRSIINPKYDGSRKRYITTSDHIYEEIVNKK